MVETSSLLLFLFILYKNRLIQLSFIYEKNYCLKIYYSEYCFEQIEISVAYKLTIAKVCVIHRNIHKQPLYSILHITSLSYFIAFCLEYLGKIQKWDAY